MSGKKRITVDEAAWRDAQAAAARLRDVNRELPSMLETLRRQQEEQLNQVSAEAQARQDAMERALADLSEQTRKLESQLTRRLRAKAEMLFNEMRDANQQLRAETRQAIEDTETRLQADLDEERKEREQSFQSLRDALDEVKADRDRALTAARTLLADATLLRGVIDADMPHQQFAPGRLADIEQRLTMALGNLDAGLGEAALAQAQELYLQLSALRAEVEFRHQEWQAARIAANTAVTALLEQIRVNSTLEVAGTDGKLIDGVTLDVDFWSEGELAELETRVAALAELVAAQADPPDLAELRTIVQRDAPQLDEQLTAIVGRAGARQFASQVRVNLAELVVATLENTTGFVWEQGQATYAGEDPRRAFYSKLIHPDDSEIVVEVSPDEAGESCVLRILSFDSGIPDEEERVRRVHAIASDLRSSGLKVSDPAAEAELPDPALTDFDGLRQRVPGRQADSGSATSATARPASAVDRGLG